MVLSEYEKQVLAALLRYRDTPPSVLSVFKDQWKRPVAVGVIALGGAIVFSFLGWLWISLLLVGYYVGALERDFQWIGLWVKEWPLNREIIQWERVAELVDGKMNTGDQGDDPGV